MPMPTSVFERDGERFVPTELARGPWSPDAQHGGAPAGLVARAIERVEPGPTFVARLTLDLVKPVPLAPLTVDTAVLRPGKRVQVIDARVCAGDDVVVQARALRIRTADLDLPASDERSASTLTPALDSPPLVFEFPGGNRGHGFWEAVECRVARGGWRKPGPAAIWFRLAVPLVAGEEPSPVVRVAAAADFGNGISSIYEPDRYLFVNPDLTIALHRYPDGEWVALDAVTHAEPDGVGLAESALNDARGRIGRSVQALLLDRV